MIKYGTKKSIYGSNPVSIESKLKMHGILNIYTYGKNAYFQLPHQGKFAVVNLHRHGTEYHGIVNLYNKV